MPLVRGHIARLWSRGLFSIPYHAFMRPSRGRLISAAVLAGFGLLGLSRSMGAAPAPAKPDPPKPAPPAGKDDKGKAPTPAPAKPPAYVVQLTALRSINGSNSGQGAAGSTLKRIVPAAYPGDGSGATIVTDPARPNPRTISNRIAAQGTASIPSQRQLTDYAWAWGQFIDHDLDLTLTTSLAGTADIPILDPLDPLGPSPIPFSRSNFVGGTGVKGTPRQHTNLITSFIDGSQVYGSDDATALSLRTMVGGQLKTSAGDLLPTDANGQFLAGDIRVNENVALMAVQALLVREHNRLARIVAVLAPTATDEQIYQLVRKVVGAEIQIITYREFLPALMGRSAPPLSLGLGAATGDATVSTEFSTALFRVGHTMLSSKIALADGGKITGSLPLQDAFFRSDFLTKTPANFDRVLGGLGAQVSQEIDSKVVEDVRSFLFGPAGAGGLDLASLNIQRGRDHGLPDYNSLRAGVGLSRLGGFAGITSTTALKAQLESLYGTIGNVDPWVGALAEDHLTDSSLGPLLSAGLADQFRRSLSGDRFAYGRDKDLQQPLVEALLALDETTLASLVRRNSTATTLPKNAFRLGAPSGPSPGGGGGGVETTDVQATVAGRTGRVHLQGNRGANAIQLADSPLGLVCRGVNGTLINGQSMVLLETPKIASLTIDLGEGNDQVTFVNGRFKEVVLVLGGGTDVFTNVAATIDLKLSDK